MDFFIRISYYLHIAAGVLSLLAGPMALIAKKGGRLHVISGRIFFYSMTIIFLSATLNGLYKGMTFLTFVGVFSYYNIISGIRALQLRKLNGPAPVDYFIHGIALLSMLGFVAFGLSAWEVNKVFAGLAIGFGLAGVLNVKTYSGMVRHRFATLPKVAFIKWHIGGLVGGFIASVTAFSVQTMHFLPDLWQWLWPTAVFVPVIAYWQRRYPVQQKATA